MLQLPEEQDGVPFAEEHTLPHTPQLSGFAPILISHPLRGLPSQSANPGLHVIPQTPEEQVGVPPTEEHTFPHAPQLFTSVDRLKQFPEQYEVPAGHELIVHVVIVEAGAVMVAVDTGGGGAVIVTRSAVMVIIEACGGGRVIVEGGRLMVEGGGGGRVMVESGRGGRVIVAAGGGGRVIVEAGRVMVVAIQVPVVAEASFEAKQLQALLSLEVDARHFVRKVGIPVVAVIV
jgi:hypothetical protein